MAGRYHDCQLGLQLPTKCSCNDLQKVFAILCKKGLQKTTGDIKTIKIGVFSDINGDIIYDLLFHLSLRCENGEIMEAEIIECEETTMLGTYIIDRDDLIHGFGMTENNPYGLQKRFSGFMDNMTERGPYLTNPKEIKRYHKTLVD